MKKHVLLIVVSGLLLFPFTAFASDKGFDLFLGTSWHGNHPIEIGGHIIESPEWETRPLSSPPYYSIRFYWANHELELIHDKVYMGYDTPNVQKFNMSDGYNMFLYNFRWLREKWETRLGVGPLVVHPEGVVDGILIGAHGDQNFQFGGIGAQFALGYRQPIRSNFSFMLEGKLTAGLTQVRDVPGGTIRAPISGLHFLLGIGYHM